MITIEEKLNLFSKHVFEEVQKECKEEIEKVEAHIDRVKKEHRKKIQQEARNFVERKIKEQRKKNNQLLSKVKGEVNKSILMEKKEKLEELIGDIREKLVIFTQDKDYGNYLKSSLSQSLVQLEKTHSIEIYMLQRDLSQFGPMINQLLKEMGWSKEQVTMIPIEEDIIGGIRIIDRDRGISLDTTLATRIKEKERYIGEILYKELEKIGEDNGTI